MRLHEERILSACLLLSLSLSIWNNILIYTQPARNVGPTSGRQRYDVVTSYRCRSDVGPLFRSSWVSSNSFLIPYCYLLWVLPCYSCILAALIHCMGRLVTYLKRTCRSALLHRKTNKYICTMRSNTSSLGQESVMSVFLVRALNQRYVSLPNIKHWNECIIRKAKTWVGGGGMGKGGEGSA